MADMIGAAAPLPKRGIAATVARYRCIAEAIKGGGLMIEARCTAYSAAASESSMGKGNSEATDAATSPAFAITAR